VALPALEPPRPALRLARETAIRTGAAAVGRRLAGHDGLHRRPGRGWLLLGTRLELDLGRRLLGHLVADDRVFGQADLVVPDPLDRVVGRLDVRVRDQDDVGAAARFQLVEPLALLVDQERRDVHRQLRDHARRAVLADLLAHEAQHGQRHRLDAADGAHAAAARADGVRRLAQRRSQALARHLEQAEARDASELDAGAVHLDRIAQPVLDRLLVLLRLHVDEVDDDQAAEVAQAQLARDLVRRLEVGVAGSRLDVAAAGGARRVDVDGDQRLGVVDDDAAAGGQVHRVRVGRLDLALDLVAREQRDVVA
jgi:hypothetical protein